MWLKPLYFAIALLLQMQIPSVHQAFRISSRIWLVWCVLWLLMAAWSKPTKRREFTWQRFSHAIPLLIGFMLIYNNEIAWGWLAQRVVPQTPAVAVAGLALVLGGLLFAVWARVVLGANWSGTVTIKSGHDLVRRGPYRWIRHPIYTGILMSMVGTVLLQGEVRAFLGFGLALLALYLKAKREERFLADEFGDGFAEHTKHTGMFLPRFS